MTYPPGPKTNVVSAIWSQFRPDPDRQPMKDLVKMARTYGDIVYYKAGPFRIYFIHHPDHIHEVLVGQNEKFGKGDLAKRPLKRLLGNGLFTNDGESWKRQRKLAQPAFHHHRIAAYADVMVDYTLRAVDKWEDGDSHEVLNDMAALTLNIVAKTLFDADMQENASTFTQKLEIVVDAVTNKFNAVIPIPDFIPTPGNQREKREIDALDSIMGSIIAEHRESGEDRGDLLSMLMLARDEETGEGMSDKQLRDECMTLLVAGHETTANAMAWVWYLLAKHPEAEARLHEEVDTALGGRPATVNDLPNLPYTDMILKETLRMYPPAPFFTREVFQDVTIGGYPLKKGSTVIISPYVVGHDPRWYPEPDRFLPERWANDFEKTIPRYAYLPFGGGPRICIGNNFAQMEARLVMATVAQRWRFLLAPGQEVRPGSMLTLRPKDALPMQVARRAVRVPEPQGEQTANG